MVGYIQMIFALIKALAQYMCINWATQYTTSKKAL